MSTPEERVLMSKNVDMIIAKACNRNPDAERYLHDMAWSNRIIDDLYDGDVPVSKEDIEKVFWIIAIEIPNNPFYVNYRQALMTQYIIIYNAWMDANRWENDENKKKKICSHFIKEYIGELIPLVAYLTGGTVHMRNISLMARELFLKEF